ncbi:IS110 family transposase [Streptomyces calidiresistens]|uniref:IS110 family transposase n=1 Tax=Streptomyces calidiresistens TaxID=1485586 RepID=A0A7W3T2J8_9ACTN|nr:IS110 family transposase [Streptomyces calidiresistens]MBB0229785.1 IS110 family transposase [Streptomyces calidiresistens]
MHVTCGIDWAEDHHDIAVVDTDARLLGKLRIGDDATGFQDLLRLLAEHGDSPEDPIPIAIETSRGLLVACLRASGRRVYAINPMAVARYRDRHAVSRKKSDHQDAVVLANILRTDADLHRPLPDDSDLVRAIAVLARAQQDTVWDRTRAHNRLRSHLREYYPAILEAFADKRERLLAREARAILAVAPTPGEAARLTRSRLKVAVTRAGRQRRIDAETDRLLEVLRRTRLRQPGLVEAAMGRQTLALLAQLDAACHACDDLARATEELFLQHPDAEIITSFPGLAVLTGARILAEIGDDRTRFDTARDLKAYAGSAPVTRESGRSRRVSHRRIKNSRLAATGRHWAFAALTASPGAHAHYNRRRETGDRYYAALRHLFNRMIGQLHHCLTTHQKFDETTAFTPPTKPQLATAA